MLTGRRAFDGDDISTTLAAVIMKEPDLAAVPPDTPPSIRRLLRRCLEKDPKRRLRDIGDARLELESASESGVVPPVQTLPRQRRWPWIAALLVVAIAASTFIVLLRLTARPSTQVVRFQVYPPPNGTFLSSTASGATVSPDGTRLVFPATGADGKPLLWLRPLDSVVAAPLAGTDDALWPFWSPDSRSVGFFTPSTLKKIDLNSRGVTVVATELKYSAMMKGGAWSPDGTIIFGALGSPISRVAANGGPVAPVTRLEHGQTSHGWPAFLPDGRRFLYHAIGGDAGRGAVYAASLDSSAVTRILDADTNALFVVPDSLLFMKAGALLRQPLDVARLAIRGDATVVVPRVGQLFDLGAFAVSNTGVLSFQTPDSSTNQLVWIDRASRREVAQLGGPGTIGTPTLSPDGRWLAFILGDSTLTTSDIWLVDIQRQTAPSRLTFNQARLPVWSPDSSRLFYVTGFLGSNCKIVSRAILGVAGESPVAPCPKTDSGPVLTGLSQDGKTLLYFADSGDPKTNMDIFTLELTGGAMPVPVTHGPGTEGEGQFSPDGHWIAYTASTETESGGEVFVEPFPPNGTTKWLVSPGGSGQPIWRQDGKELFFVNGHQFFAVGVRTSPTFEFGTPHLMFDVPANTFAARNSYWPNKDGTKFVVNKLISTTPSPITVAVNWNAPPSK